MTDPTQYIEGRTVQEQMNSLISYVDTRAAEVASPYADAADASAQAAAQSAQDASDTVSDCVKKTPAAAQTITAYPLTVSQGVNANVTGNVTGNVSGNITSSGTSAFSGTVTVPTIATGTANTKAANGTKVLNELNNYAAMVRTTGNQTIAGIKSFNAIRLSTSGIQATAAGSYAVCRITVGASQSYEITLSAVLRSHMALSKVVITTDADSAVSGITSTHIAATASTMGDYIGAYTEDGYLYVYVRAVYINRYFAVTILGFHGNYGYPIAPELINYTSVTPGNDAMDVTI